MPNRGVFLFDAGRPLPCTEYGWDTVSCFAALDDLTGRRTPTVVCREWWSACDAEDEPGSMLMLTVDDLGTYSVTVSTENRTREVRVEMRRSWSFDLGRGNA